MRAKEFINEAKVGKIPADLKASSQGMIKMRDKPLADRAYHMSRMGLVLAMANGKDTKPIQGVDAASFAEKYNICIPYTDLEELMVFQAMATIPTDSQELVKRSKSEELPDTNTVSPVSTWMKKK